METIGIRILDGEDNVVSVKLSDILNIIDDGNIFNWAILFSDIILVSEITLQEGKSIIAQEKQINKSANGLHISWGELKSLSKKIHQEIDLIIIGCKNKENLHRYNSDIIMYNTCDIVIEMIDSSFWQVFSKDGDLIKRLAKKFKDTKFLSPDFKR